MLESKSKLELNVGELYGFPPDLQGEMANTVDLQKDSYYGSIIRCNYALWTQIQLLSKRLLSKI